MRSGTDIDLSFWSVMGSQTHRRGLGPIETCNSGAKFAVLNAKPKVRSGTHRDL